MINGFRICGVRLFIGQNAANKAFLSRRRTEGRGWLCAGAHRSGRGARRRKGMLLAVVRKDEKGGARRRSAESRTG